MAIVVADVLAVWMIRKLCDVALKKTTDLLFGNNNRADVQLQIKNLLKARKPIQGLDSRVEVYTRPILENSNTDATT
jgi:hypothetical protein